LTSDEARLAFQREVTAILWDRRDPELSLYGWLSTLRANIVVPRVKAARSLNDELGLLRDLIKRLDAVMGRRLKSSQVGGCSSE
jgi:hypothetical protein